MTSLLPDATGSFRRQIVVLTTCVVAFAMVVLTVVLQVVLADLSKSTVDRVLEDRADAVVGSVVDASTGAGLEVPTAELDTGVVVYDASGAAVVGIAPGRLQEAYTDLSTTSVTHYRTVGETRLIAEPFSTPSGTEGVVLVSERFAPYESAERYALIVSLITGALATAASAAIAAWVTSRALGPVAVLARTAADWSEHDLSRRFALGPPTNEIAALAAILDTLLDKVSAAIRSEQRLTSELAHELRTPLTAVQASADLALMDDNLTPDAREFMADIADAARRMATTITTLLDVARTGATQLEASACWLDEVIAEVVRSLPPHQLEVQVSVLNDRVAAPATILTRALSPVVENAVRFARHRVEITAPDASGGDIVLVISDDGPGVDLPDETVFLPGTTSLGGSGAGLGLALARRLARSIGGDLDLAQAQAPTRFEFRLPRS
ncbi:sensor histidine kinase [Nocardioides zhouii]|uniref:histidine kinase n=1 Tax=Nocardioides zhouii TaxID=1168729 RepID=A0A4Q2TAZ8_9ACTN|nr:HAMP domain-containing sensor histidine kinase [Nocardioides zhouii]RYC14324.1 HAMP domain-containing histidine kinase [Nocardioides zhouii]